jgi:hypothetical protein
VQQHLGRRAGGVLKAVDAAGRRLAPRPRSRRQRALLELRRPRDPARARDTSATAIATASLLKLAALGDARYRAAAEGIVDAMAERHLTRHGGRGDDCYDQHQNLATASELI